VKAAPFLAAAGIVLGAIWWGGGTTREAEAAVLGTTGALLLLAPARQGPARGFGWLALLWLMLAAAAFLPQKFFPSPAWRSRVVEAGIVLPDTLTPQPRLTLEALAWLAAGLAWLGWLQARSLDGDTRRITLRTLALGLTAVAATALIAKGMHSQIPGWLSAPAFGPFPNRNHTGTVLALGGIIALGCGFDTARRRPWRAAAWIVCAAVLGAALIVNYSRGGVLLFLGAAGLWAAIAAWQKRSWKIATLGAAALLAGAACVLISSQAMAARFAGGSDSQIAFRTLIWRDTLDLIGAAPWCGTGLGNFRALFPFFRHASLNTSAVWHPESDWLWLASETSWLGVALAAAIFSLAAREAFPLARGTQRRLRTPALVGAIGAALHGLIDVPAHRPGSAFLALLLLALARKDSVAASPSVAAAWLWRGIGIALIATSICWLRVRDDLALTEAFVAEGKFPEAQAAAERMISRAPLDWQGYYARAAVAANERRVLSALADFRRARLLEPHHVAVPLEEGRVWAGLIPALALPAWEDALHRVPPGPDEELFRAILDTAPREPDFQVRLRELIKDRPNLLRQWESANPGAVKP
jgi:O-antigen ligase